MGSGGNGPYSGGKTGPASFSSMHSHVTSWALKKKDTLTGKQKRGFNTACVAVDTKTGAVYYGRNNGIASEGQAKNPLLFGGGSEAGILPNPSLNNYSVGNCAEAHAINTALNAGASIENLQLMTIHVTKSKFGKQKCACENCTEAFKGRVAENYSGWKW